jgi:hypothetical protein
VKKNMINSTLLSLEDLEGSENEALTRIVSSLQSGRTDGMSHSSHSSSSGRGHTSYVSGTGHAEQPQNK